MSSVTPNKEVSVSSPREPNPEFKPPVSASQVPAPLDLELLNQNLGVEEAGEILKLFVVSSQDLIDQISQAITSRNTTLLKEASHTLKGACSSIGANQMTRRCVEIEKANSNSDWIALAQLFSELVVEFEQVSRFVSGLQ